ncbi:restriction endonuclease subunit S [Acinetobacter haemolyticus]|uniref:restriction endonuclease subunit S n=1 Tax=Acinetobacter haemolyticus TaxID=29430 RepID=UPI003F561691
MTDVKKLITEHLDIWLTAETEKKSGRGRSSGSSNSIYGVQKLRELILDLAIRGKLLPQNIKDEPVSLLIEKITDEKNQKVLVGEIKKQKSLPKITAPFQIPSNWQWLYLQDLSSYIQRGKSPKYIEKSDKIVISQKCVRWSGLDISPARFIDPKSLENYEKIRFLKDGDILWNSTGTGTIGRASLFFQIDTYQNIVADSHVTVVRTLGNISDYIYLVIRSPYIQKDLESSASGTTNQIELNTSTVLQTRIPLPPIEEQKRIVAKVDELMQLCDQLEQQQNLSSEAHDQLVNTLLNVLTNSSDADEFQQNWWHISENFDLLFTTEYSIDQLKQTILQLAVMGKLVKQDPNDEPVSVLLKQITEEKAKLVKEGKIKKSKPLPEIGEDEKPFELPDGWETAYLGNILLKLTDGTHHSPPNIEEGDYLYISAKNIRDNYLDLNNVTYVTKTIHDEIYSRCNPEYGDILYIKDGATTGKSCINTLLEPFSMLSSVALLKLPQKYIFNNFLLLVLQSPFFYAAMRKEMSGIAITRVTLAKLNSSVVVIPPFNEQKKIAAKVNQLFSMIEKLQTLQGKLQRTKFHLADSLVANALLDSIDRNEPETEDNLIQFEKPIETIKQSKQKGTDQIDLFTDESIDDDLKLLSLAAEITFQLHTEPTFGHLKLQKLIYLCQQLKHMDLAADFKQHAAGPYDRNIATYIDTEFKKRHWFSYHQDETPKYKQLRKCGDHKREFDRFFKSEAFEIYELIGWFRTCTSRHIEIVATLFACWLRLLEQKQLVTEEQLLCDFYAWSEEKSKFSKVEVLNGYKWMKQNSVVPL